MKNAKKVGLLGVVLMLGSLSAFADECDGPHLMRHENLRQACKATLTTDAYIVRAKEANRGKFHVERQCNEALRLSQETREAIHQSARDAG